MIADDPRPLIAHVVHRFGVGGLENGLVNLINGLPRAQWRHLIIALTEVSPDFAKRIDRGDVEYISLNKPPGHLFGQYSKLYRIFRRKRPLIVHTRNLAALEATVPAWAARVPARVHGEHGWDVGDLGGQSRKHVWIRRLYAPFVTRWIAMSRDLERYLTERVAIPPRQVTQIYNGVDIQRFERRGADRMAIPGSPFSDPRLWLVGTVGRMQTVKDQTTLVRAFIAAIQRRPAAAERMRLVLVGGGPLFDSARDLLEKAQLAPLAWLAGERSDIPTIMSGLDCFVLPSLAEGISNTILEAQATGLPVIATRVGGNPELIDDGQTGRMVPAADADALAAAILEMFDAPERARELGRRARKVVEERFSLSRMLADYRALYDGQLRARPLNT